MKLEWISGKSGYIKTELALIGVYCLSNHEVILFDSGEKVYPELLDFCKQNQIRVRAVICTHLHHDHTSNNEALIKEFNAEIFSHQEDISYFRDNPYYTFDYPLTSFGGASGSLYIDGIEIRYILTPGHCPGHSIFITPDDVCYLGDAIITQQVLDHSKLPYMLNVDQALISMEEIRRTHHAFYAIAHMGVIPYDELDTLIEANIQKELDLYALIRTRVTVPTPLADVISDYLSVIGIHPDRHKEDYMIRGVRARIDALTKAGEFYIQDDLLIPSPQSSTTENDCESVK